MKTRGKIPQNIVFLSSTKIQIETKCKFDNKIFSTYLKRTPYYYTHKHTHTHTNTCEIKCLLHCTHDYFIFKYWKLNFTFLFSIFTQLSILGMLSFERTLFHLAAM